MTASITKASGWKPRPMMVPMGPRDGPRQGVHKAVHAQEVDKDLEDPDVGDRGKDERDKEDGVEHDGRGEQQRLVDGKAHGDDGGLTDGARISRDLARSRT